MFTFYSYTDRSAGRAWKAKRAWRGWQAGRRREIGTHERVGDLAPIQDNDEGGQEDTRRRIGQRHANVRWIVYDIMNNVFNISQLAVERRTSAVSRPWSVVGGRLRSIDVARAQLTERLSRVSCLGSLVLGR